MTPATPIRRATPNDRVPVPWPAAALAGLAAGAAALGIAELVAGLLPGAASPVIAIGDAIIALQPPGAKQFVVDLFGEADKVILVTFIAMVALGVSAALGALARRRPGAAQLGFTTFGLAYLAAGLRDPLADPLPTLIAVAAAVTVAVLVLGWLLRMLRRMVDPPVSMPAWGRRRFLGTSVGIMAAALGSGVAGRVLLAQARAGAVAQAAALPAPATTAPPIPDGARLSGVEGLTPLVTPNERFYRIDTALLTPRPRLATWRLRVHGLVDAPFELTYDELAALPIHEQYVTIACVSNEVGGTLVGNALWGGVRLRELLDRARVRPEGTQIVGRSVDNFTAGFPLAWALAADREPLVALTMNGDPLPPDHGFPARLIVPGLFGYVSATKWLSDIELTTWEGFNGYWVPLGWAKEGPILTQSRIDVPRPFATLAAGPTPIAGVAWAPDRGISAVEVRVDDGEWQPAELSTPISDATWVQWVVRWEATEGEHRIRVRATDGAGEIQTDERTPPAPDGARGHHIIEVTVT
ncbi:MAG TPA: molybdopterin-dependent oxidoreductase [Candidatus Angelobacter sp.]|nr:molybdopterin-dependent oxidoreductase [Candidatus Angelobacter sp.]